MVHNVVLVSTMFALRLVPRGVVKSIAISKKRGIPRYMPCKTSTTLYTTQVPRYILRKYHVLYHVITTLYTKIYAQLVPCNAHVFTFIGHLLETKILPRPAQPPAAAARRHPPPPSPFAPPLPPLRLIFSHWSIVYLHEKYFKCTL